MAVDSDYVTDRAAGSRQTVTGQQPEQDLNSPREECGVFGVWAPGEDVAKLTYYGLYALQHRGQEAAGIAVADGSQVLVFKDLGLVSQVFDEQTLAAMQGHVAIGHCRYSTTGDTTWENAQPVFRNTAAGTGVALGHNGNLVNAAALAARARDAGLIATRCPAPATTDSDILGALLAHGAADSTLEQAALDLLPTVRGAFCLTFMDENTLYACRDPYGVRPLSLGRLDRGWVVASETAALDIVGASFVRDIEPGELLAIDADGVRSTRFANPTPKGCVFEYVYLARPDSTIAGRSVHAARVEIGRRLARECPVEADLVIGVPGIRHTRRGRLRAGVRRSIWAGSDEERLCRAHLHPAVTDHPSARHPAEAQPAQRGDPRQAAHRRRRLDRAGQHPACAGTHAARGPVRSNCMCASPRHR